MAESVIEELKKIGQALNAKKNKTLFCNPSFNDESIDFVELNGEFVKVLEENDSHRYLGKQLSTSASNRNGIEIKNRKQTGWIAFGKHMSNLLDRNVSLQHCKRLRKINIFDNQYRPGRSLNPHQ